MGKLEKIANRMLLFQEQFVCRWRKVCDFFFCLSVAVIWKDESICKNQMDRDANNFLKYWNYFPSVSCGRR